MESEDISVDYRKTYVYSDKTSCSYSEQSPMHPPSSPNILEANKDRSVEADYDDIDMDYRKTYVYPEDMQQPCREHASVKAVNTPTISKSRLNMKKPVLSTPHSQKPVKRSLEEDHQQDDTTLRPSKPKLRIETGQKF